MAGRADLVASIAREIADTRDGGFTRVGVDGVDGAGKTVFADELAVELARSGVRVARVSVDGFHNPRAVRYRRGRDSPEGFFLDSYDYASLVSLVLAPFDDGGSGRYVPAVYDVVADRPVASDPLQAPDGSILIVDGIFLHRDELASFWDYSIWLDVPFEISIARCSGLGAADAGDPSNRRYVEGQLLYVQRCAPAERATVVIDNSVLVAPIRREGRRSHV
jgi:uridine kinase